MSYEEYAKTARAIKEHSEEMRKELSKYGPDYYFEKVEGYIKVLFERFAPFKKGDRVILTKTPEINKEESWGWIGSKHFLVKGAKATVCEVDYYREKFRCSVKFDDDSHINHVTQQVELTPPDRRSFYSFNEDFLVKIDG